MTTWKAIYQNDAKKKYNIKPLSFLGELAMSFSTKLGINLKAKRKSVAVKPNHGTSFQKDSPPTVTMDAQPKRAASS